MPQLTTYLIQSGIPEGALIWIFMLPVTVTAAVIGRQIIGIKGFSISMPILVGFAFVAAGLQSGIIIYIAVLGAGVLIKLLLGNIRLLYLPKMALILLGAIAVLSILIPLLPNKDDMQFSYLAFSFIIFIFSTEQFSSLLIERGIRKTSGVALETLATSIAVFFLVTWDWLQGIVISYPAFVILASVFVNFFLGKWTALRLSEYIRFKDIIFK